MAIDSDKVKARLMAKYGKGDSDTPKPDMGDGKEPDGDEAEPSAGQMLLDAVDARDPDAVEEAIKRCVAGGY